MDSRRNPTRRVLFLGALFLVASNPAWRCFAADPSFSEAAAQRLIDAVKGDTPGLAVLVARDGEILFQGGYGLADLEKKSPTTPETKFRIGSITKQFTAVAVLQLAEQGKLSLDDSLAKYFPDFPGGDKVNFRHLLTHTSGLHSYTDKPEFIGRVKQPINPAELIAWFQYDKPDFAPGEGFHYNNSAYFLLGEIVAKVSGKSFGDHLKATIFDPLEMSNTGIYVNSDAPSGMASSYSFVNEKFEPAFDWDMSWAGGAGAIYSTVGDLYRWNEALYGGRVLSDASLKAATTPVELPPNVDGMNYGYGLMMLNVKRLPAVGHGGGLNGWSSYLVRLPEQKCTVVVLANALPHPPAHSPSAIAHGLAERLLTDEIEKIPPATEDKSIDPKSFADYVGRFDYQGAIMTVSVEGDAIFSQITGQPQHRIYPKAKDAFFGKVAHAEVMFLRDQKGQVTAARHSQNGSTFRAAKIPDDAVKLTAEQVAPFVGQYQYGELAILTVSRDGSQLFAQLTGQPRFPIFPKSETEFEWRVVAASVKFSKDDDGKVTKAIHTQNGNTSEAPKVK